MKKIRTTSTQTNILSVKMLKKYQISFGTYTACCICNK